MQALGDDDVANIHQTIDDEVLDARGHQVPLDRGAGRADGGMRVEGDLTLAARPSRSRSTSTVGDDGALERHRRRHAERWGMKPYSALFGALKVEDEVEVVLEGHL